jgi:hypothetical protein
LKSVDAQFKQPDRIDSKMDIPTRIAAAIAPYHDDYITRSVVYTFNKLSAYEVTDTHCIFRFPYSANTFWTNYKYTMYSSEKSSLNHLKIGIKVKLTNGEIRTISESDELEPSRWYSIAHWVIPSVQPNNDNYIYFKVSNTSDEFRISLLGFTDLFPKSTSYVLLSHNEVNPNVWVGNEGYRSAFIFKKSPSDTEYDSIELSNDDYMNMTQILPISDYL